MPYQILKNIKSPDDIKSLNKNDINVLCDEIRDCIIKTVSKNGGHLSSNLGAVELTVAIHRIFSSPNDSIIFDVGHQCYAHKLLTGRFDRFNTLRKENGISGFMRPDESEHDPFITGHSSNSISAALGIYKAKSLKGENGASIAVIGDGAMTGGMVFEALNNAGNEKGRLIIILNDNKMSISKNVGSVARYLNVIRNKPNYYRFKSGFGSFLKHIPLIGKFVYSFIFKFKKMIKNAIYQSNMFENLGFDYLGPVDGHNVEKLENILTIAKEQNKPTLIHVITQKGKGFKYAEENPDNYHGVSSFDIDQGVAASNKITFSDISGAKITELAQTDDKICAITAAMKEGTGLSEFAKKYKSRFFDVGIAEEHAITFASGLATGGYNPFFFVYSSFLQRAYDQIIHDAAIAGLPVKICVDRAGIVGADGETHQGLFDVSFLSSIPGMNVYSPCFYDELENVLEKVSKNDELCAIRYPRGCEDSELKFIVFDEEFTVVNDTSDIVLISYGSEFYQTLRAYNELLKIGKNVSLIKLNKIYPLSNSLVLKLKKYNKIFLYEEVIKSGGIGEHLSAMLFENDYKGEYKIFAVNNCFVGAGEHDSLIKKFGLDSRSIISNVLENLK